MITALCRHCGREPGTLVCTGCRTAAYCSTDWSAPAVVPALRVLIENQPARFLEAGPQGALSREVHQQATHAHRAPQPSLPSPEPRRRAINPCSRSMGTLNSMRHGYRPQVCYSYRPPNVLVDVDPVDILNLRIPRFTLPSQTLQPSSSSVKICIYPTNAPLSTSHMRPMKFAVRALLFFFSFSRISR
jgi:hypothetical protein